MKLLNIVIILILFVGLVGVRVLENKIFYDPFLEYFKNSSSLISDFPQVDYFKLIISHVFRYTLNSILSLGIIYFWFKKIEYVKISSILLIIVFIVLLPIYVYLVGTEFNIGKMPTFYIRRFLIQPIVLFILIPSFYYIRLQKK